MTYGTNNRKHHVCDCGYRLRPGLSPAVNDGDHPVLHVGFSHQPQRHSNPPPEIGLRSELCKGHADSIRVLHFVFRVFAAVWKIDRRRRLQESHGGGLVHNGLWRAAFYSRSKRSIVSLFPYRAHRSCSRHDHPASVGEPLRRDSGPGENGRKSIESRAGLQFSGYHDRPETGRFADPQQRPPGGRSDASNVRSRLASVSNPRSILGKNALSRFRAGTYGVGRRHRALQAPAHRFRGTTAGHGTRFHLAPQPFDSRRGGNFRVRGRGSFHRQLSGELLQPAGHRQHFREGGRRPGFVLLGRSDGWPLHRIGTAAKNRTQQDSGRSRFGRCSCWSSHRC